MRAILSGNGDEAQSTMRDHVNLLGDQFADFLSALSSSAGHASVIADRSGRKDILGAPDPRASSGWRDRLPSTSHS